MKSNNALAKASLSSLLVPFLLFGAGCAASLELVRNSFLDYDSLSTRLTRLQADYPDIISVQSIGKTYEGRSILAVKVTGDGSTHTNKPALMAIFTEHGAEHDVTDVGVAIAEYLAKANGKDDHITKLLKQKEVWLLPMVNPDGVEYDFSGSVKPFSWRKNRRRTGENTYGVDLNRNWGHKWNAPVPEDLAEDLNDKESRHYAGESPFSERETRAIRDFLLSHPNVKMFVDYHSGGAPFIQGGVGFPLPRSEKEALPPGHRERYEQVAEQFAARMSNPKDKRPAFVVAKERDVAKTIKKHAPWYIDPFIPKSIPPAPGTSGEWVYGELGIMVFGVEIFRNTDFFRRLPESKNELVENQIRGFLFLLDVLSEEPFQWTSAREVSTETGL